MNIHTITGLLLSMDIERLGGEFDITCTALQKEMVIAAIRENLETIGLTFTGKASEIKSLKIYPNYKINLLEGDHFSIKACFQNDIQKS